MKITKNDKISKSKYLALVLRHKPEAIGIQLDKNGWADIQELISKWNKGSITKDEIFDIVRTDDKNRYEISSDQAKIRARQGHSLKNIDVQLEVKNPPDVLYHGTVDKFIQPIKQSGGLIKGNRQYVHLSGDPQTATNVGSRRGKPVVITIDAKRMREDGIVFYQSSNGVWLTDFVDKKYFTNIMV